MSAVDASVSDSSSSAASSAPHTAASLPPSSAPSHIAPSSSRFTARSASADSSSSRSARVSSLSAPRPVRRRADAVTSLRARSDSPGLIRHARKVDDDCTDAAYNWRMGLIVERLPTVLNPSPAWEVEWEGHMQLKEARTAIPIPDALKPSPEPKVDLTPIETDTADDAADNRQSLNRRARDSLYLLVRKQSGHTGESTWTFPSVRYTALPYASITPKQAAASSIRQTAGESVRVHTLSNAPIAYHRYEYSAQYRSQASTQQRGGKLFLFHALYLSGTVDLNEQRAPVDSLSRYTDYVWVPRSQLHDYIADPELLHLAIDVLITDADYADDTDVQQLERQQRERQRNIVYTQQQERQLQHGSSNGGHHRVVASRLTSADPSTVQQRQERSQLRQ